MRNWSRWAVCGHSHHCLDLKKTLCGKITAGIRCYIWKYEVIAVAVGHEEAPSFISGGGGDTSKSELFANASLMSPRSVCSVPVTMNRSLVFNQERVSSSRSNKRLHL
jgi:hypothetical protein